MPTSRFGVALIVAAGAALALLAVSLGWFSSPAESTNSSFPFESAEVTATLAKLSAPPGFHRGACVQLPGNVDTACFRRARSIVLNPAVMAAFVASFGAKLDVQVDRELGQNAAKPSSCHPLRRYAIQHDTVPRPTFLGCNVLVKLGSQHMDVMVTSVVLADATSMVSTTKSAFRTPGGSQITVTDVGS
jgi:hypothetical protein